MKFAYDASLRSSAAGRQVGASLVSGEGTLLVVGTNEVPKPGGGQYSEGDYIDGRDFTRNSDPNAYYIEQTITELFERLDKDKWFAKDHIMKKYMKKDSEDITVDQLAKLALYGSVSNSIPSLLKGSRAASLIEFTRCLHAEQAAIINAVRSVVSIQNAVLYTTTFPCHECAKMIVGTGISAVHFIEPYPKSLVGELYSDVIDIDPSLSDSPEYCGGKIPFYQYVGIAPRWYQRAFVAQERKTDNNELVKLHRPTANPKTHGWDYARVTKQEVFVAHTFQRLTDNLSKELKQKNCATSDEHLDEESSD